MTELATAPSAPRAGDAIPNDLVVPYYLDDRKLRISVARVDDRLYAFDDLCTCAERAVPALRRAAHRDDDHVPVPRLPVRHHHRRRDRRPGDQGARGVRGPRGRRRHSNPHHLRQEKTCPRSISTRRPPRRPEQFVAGLTDFGPGRSELFRQQRRQRPEGALLRAPPRPTSPRARAASGSACTTTGPIPNHVVAQDDRLERVGRQLRPHLHFKRNPDGTTDIDYVVVREGKNLKGRFLGVVLGSVGKGRWQGVRQRVKAIEARNNGAGRPTPPSVSASWLRRVRPCAALPRARSAPSRWTRRSTGGTATTAATPPSRRWESSEGLMSWDDAPAPAQVGQEAARARARHEVSPRYARLLNNVTHWGFGLAAGAAVRAPRRLAAHAEGVVRAPVRRRGLGQRIRRAPAARRLRADLEVRPRDAREGSERAPRLRDRHRGCVLRCSPERSRPVTTLADHASIEPQFRTIDGLRIRYADSGGSQRAGGAADEPLAGEPVRVRADVGDARRARPPVRRRPARVRRLRTPGRSAVSARDGRVPGPAHRRGRSGQAAHRRAGRRDRRPRCSRRRRIPSGSRA